MHGPHAQCTLPVDTTTLPSDSTAMAWPYSAAGLSPVLLSSVHVAVRQHRHGMAIQRSWTVSRVAEQRPCGSGPRHHQLVGAVSILHSRCDFQPRLRPRVQ